MFGRSKKEQSNQIQDFERAFRDQLEDYKEGSISQFQSTNNEENRILEVVNQLLLAEENHADTVIRTITTLLNEVTGMTYVKKMVQDVTNQTSIIEGVAASSEEMASTVEDMSHFVQQSADSASQSIQDTSKNIEEIELSLTATTTAIDEFQEIKVQITELSKDMQSINEMVSIIKGIADQTNLLALNASIEAARAGDAGRGFAVVADEIKKLAETTKESVEFIEKTTVDLDRGMDKTIERLDLSDKQFVASNRQLQESVQSISGISTSMRRIYDNMMQISANIEEQTAASEEIASSMMQMLENSRALMAECDQTGRGIYELSVNIDKARIATWDTLRTHHPLTSIEICVTDHLIWTWRVYNMILGYERIDASQVGDHRSCRLGKWLATLDTSNSQISSVLNALEAPHKALHECAKAAVIAYNSGDVEQADYILGDMEGYSKEVIGHMQDLRKCFR